MKRIVALLVAFALVPGPCWAGVVKTGDAKESAASITISGEMEFDAVLKRPEIAEQHYLDADSVSGISPEITLRFDAELLDKVKGVLEFETQAEPGKELIRDIWGARGGGLEFEIEQVYIEAGELLTAPLTGYLGIKDLEYELRPGKGAFFVSIPENDATQTQEFVGLQMLYADGPINLLTAWGTIDEELINYNDTHVWYIGLDYKLTDEKSKIHGGIGVVQDHELKGLWYDIGLGADYYVMPELDVYGEVHFQMGEDREILYRGRERGRDASGIGLYLGAQYSFPESGAMAPYVDLQFKHLSGDDKPADDEAENYLSFENVDGFVIIEDNDFGLDWDDLDVGLQAVKLWGGLLTDARRPKDLHARVGLGWFRTNEDVKGTVGIPPKQKKTKDLGIEFDVKVDYAYSDSLTIGFFGGYLFSSDILEIRTPKAKWEDSTYLVGIDTTLKF